MHIITQMNINTQEHCDFSISGSRVLAFLTFWEGMTTNTTALSGFERFLQQVDQAKIAYQWLPCLGW